MTKRICTVFSVIFSLFFISWVYADTNLPTPVDSSQSLNGIVAVVNQQVVTQTELDAAMQQGRHELAASANPAAIDDAHLRTMVLQQLINEKLQLEMASRAKITVSEAQVTQAIEKLAGNYHMTIAELKNKLQQQGMSYTAYRKMIHNQLLIHQVQQTAVGPQVSITDQDIANARAQYEAQTQNQQQFHMIDIVSDSKADAEHIAMQLKNGADINKVAPKATNDLGWQTADTLPTIFLAQLKHMQTGDVAGPIQAPNGFHVIKLIGMRGQSTTPSKAELQNFAYQMKMQKAVNNWLKQLRKTAYIKITP